MIFIKCQTEGKGLPDYFELSIIHRYRWFYHVTPGQSQHPWHERLRSYQIAFPHIGFEAAELEEEAGALLAEGGVQDVGKHPLLQSRIPFEHRELLCFNAEAVDAQGVHAAKEPPQPQARQPIRHERPVNLFPLSIYEQCPIK